MARTIQEIQQAIIDDKNARAELSELNSPSNVAIWYVWTYIVALAIQLHELIFDQHKTDVQEIANNAIPGTLQWWVRELEKFQYSATNPQNIVLVDLVPTYPTIDEDLQILTRISVTESPNLTVNIKVAKEEPPVKLLPAEITALTDYVDTVKPAGVKTQIVSLDADRLRLEATIYYDGAYSTTIQNDTINALTEFLVNLPFDGKLRIVDIVEALQAVPGFVDVSHNSVKARAATTLLVDAAEVKRVYNTVSGRIIEEDTAGNTFADTLTFAIE